MNIIILCDQTDCIFNKRYSPPETTKGVWYNTVWSSHCTHPRPVILTIFGETLSDEICTCHSKARQND